ncbi:MAG: peptide chain release factor N(5)-glutamine methyltransferase [Pseudomonadota bacterium]
MSARTAFADAVARLRAAGVEGPERDCRLLLAEALGIAPDRLILQMREPISTHARARFEAMVAARAARQPLSQIVGRRLFFGRCFRVTPDVLDPRPETETLVAQALAMPFTRMLDLGTGTGILAITLLSERQDARGMAVDISPAALEIARDNAASHRVLPRLNIVQSDWFEAVEGQFDLIVSNPPYIAATEMLGLAPEVRDHEPPIALTDHGDGLGAYRAIAARVLAFLCPGGRLIVEIGHTQEAAISQLMREAGLIDITCIADLDGRDRAICAKAPG